MSRHWGAIYPPFCFQVEARLSKLAAVTSIQWDWAWTWALGPQSLLQTCDKTARDRWGCSSCPASRWSPCPWCRVGPGYPDLSPPRWMLAGSFWNMMKWLILIQNGFHVTVFKKPSFYDVCNYDVEMMLTYISIEMKLLFRCVETEHNFPCSSMQR